MEQKKSTLHRHVDALPAEGWSRWSQIKPFIPVSREKFRQLGLQGKAPARVRWGVRCTVFSNSEVLRWLADPLNYYREGK